jgi:hypothetical protein
LRREAELDIDPEVRCQLLDLAAQYEGFAASLEARNRDSP